MPTFSFLECWCFLTIYSGCSLLILTTFKNAYPHDSSLHIMLYLCPVSMENGDHRSWVPFPNGSGLSYSSSFLSHSWMWVMITCSEPSILLGPPVDKELYQNQTGRLSSHFNFSTQELLLGLLFLNICSISINLTSWVLQPSGQCDIYSVVIYRRAHGDGQPGK